MKTANLEQTHTRDSQCDAGQNSSRPQSVSAAPPSYGFDFADQAQNLNLPKLAIQRKAASGARLASPSLGGNVHNKTGLPGHLKSGIENLSGYAMDDVKVHYNSNKPAQLQAYAYTQGTDIHVGSGQEKHLPHEAWHVVQQKQGRVKPTRQMKGKTNVNDDVRLEREADVMGEKALSLDTESQVAQQKPLKMESGAGRSDKTPIQGRFGFEIEIPILFLDKQDTDINDVDGGAHFTFNNVPVDAAMRAGETDVHNGPECHVNVDHNGALNPLVKAELKQYGRDSGFDPMGTEQRSLDRAWGVVLFPHGASIMEVVTDAWDESTLSRNQTLIKIRAVINWIQARFAAINGDNQVALGNYFIGSNSPNSDHFQPRLGYFHSTYGVKLSQVPNIFRETTRQKRRLNRYANRRGNQVERPHANNLTQTSESIGKAKTAMRAIKSVWPRIGGNFFKKGSKNWNNGTEETFLGFLTLLTNYLLMFNANNAGNLAKQMVGMHYYKSDLFDLGGQLPNEIINTLRGNGALLTQTIAAIARPVGLRVGAQLTGPMAGWTVTQYLDQIFTGVQGIQGQDHSGSNLRDPLLAGSINPYSDKLGPDQLGPNGNKEVGVVMENRHLEYLDSNYGANLDRFKTWSRNEGIQYGQRNTNLEKAMHDSIAAREDGPARRPIAEWEDIMIGIYDMIRTANHR